MMNNRFSAVYLSIAIPQGWDEECVMAHLIHTPSGKRVGWLELPIADFRQILGVDETDYLKPGDAIEFRISPETIAETGIDWDMDEQA